jgi:hypothetical protein
MAFWNFGKNKKGTASPAVDNLTRTVVLMRNTVDTLCHEVAKLRERVDRQPVPTNGQVHAGSAVQDWLPIVDRMQELLLVQMGNADLAQAFGTYARQRELRASEEQPDTTWTEPNESTYENI